MSTPLTDGINALTTYANEVTGASDTTLSDAVHTLASNFWWERSPYVGSTSLFYYVITYGIAGISGNATGAYGVCPGFSI